MSKYQNIDIKVTGVSPEGIQSVSGVFKMVDTYGLPLDIIIDQLKDRGMMPDWIDFYDQAIKVGWKPKGVLSKLSEAIIDVYGIDFYTGWLSRMEEYTTLKAAL